MAITAKDVQTLRQRTGMGMMECKKALNEAEGDMQTAVDILRKNAKGKMDERTDRAAAEGTLGLAWADDRSAAALIELRTETDFTAKNDATIEAAEKCAQHALQGGAGEVQADDTVQEIVDNVRLTTKENASFARGIKYEAGSGEKIGAYMHHNRQIGVLVKVEGEADDDTLLGIAQHITAADGAMLPTPLAVDHAGLPAEDVEKKKAEFTEEAKATGKPPEIAEKISSGKLQKWMDENTLLGQAYVKDMSGKTQVKDVLPKDAKVVSFHRIQVGVE